MFRSPPDEPFADAALVPEDAQALTIDDPDHDEPRFRTLGADPMGRLLVVVYAMGPGDAIRLVGARRASPGERAA